MFMRIRKNAAKRIENRREPIRNVKIVEGLLRVSCKRILGKNSPSVNPIYLKIRKQLCSECGVDLKCWIRGTNRGPQDLYNLLNGDYSHRGRM